ncbi:uncharacterized protein LOC111331610 [Stylophora pistillata]|uniref:uncharacterized protein LOC111331610 n=1 Tax=Stylophora pistillata TaxID=50429 RepID=UPI000C051881|nr:uncharacterized protein LOC111331610 [Stylophora pistillata]
MLTSIPGALLALLLLTLYANGVVFGSSSCYYEVEDAKGKIRTPRFFANRTCSWLIKVPLPRKIILTFQTFQLYYKDEFGRQIETRLQVWDGVDDRSKLLGIFRGTKRRFSLKSSDRHLFLRLFLNNDVPLCNFEGSYVSTITKERPTVKVPVSPVRALPGHWLWCTAQGTPPVDITITNNDKVLVTGSGYALTQIYDEGTYTCTAKSQAGRDSKEIQVSLVADCKCYGHHHWEDGKARNDFICHIASPLARIFQCVPTTTMDMILPGLKIYNLPGNSFQNMDSLKMLDLQKNQIYKLNKDIFRDLTELRELYLQQNKIKELPEAVFDSLSNLQILTLGFNRIEKLPRRQFANLTTLQQLDLASNSIKELSEESLLNLTSLVRIDFSWNGIKDLPEGIFDNLKYLSYLNLHGNALTILRPDVFRNLNRLKTLDLSYNKIKELPVGIFYGTISLSKLSLSINSIQTLQEDIFEKMANLQTLNLYSNKIAHIPRDSFKNLKRLRYL